MNVQTIINIIGYTGSAFIILAYALNSLKLIKSVSSKYQLLNLFGGLFVLVNSFYFGAIPSVVISVFWVLIAIVTLVKQNTGKNKTPPQTTA